MALPNINFTIKGGGLARKGLSDDVITGLLMYSDVLPSGWTALGDVKSINSVEEAEQLYNITETSDSKYEWFQIDQYFKTNPSGKLYVGIYPSGATYDFEELTTMQQFANGKIRRFGIQMFNEALNTDDIDSINTVLEALYNNEMPAWVVYAPNTWNLDISTAIDLRASANSKWVTVFLGQDAANDGFDLATERGASVTALGKYLGFASLYYDNPNWSLGWVGQYDWKSGNENDSVRIGSSDFYNILSSQIDTLNDKGYSFLYKKVGKIGTFLNDMPSVSVLSNNDYAYIPEVATIFKAIRDVRTVLSDYINAPVDLNEDGTLSFTFVKDMEADAKNPLQEMVNNGAISNFKVLIDPDQDVLADSTIDVVIGILPTGTARYIEVSIGLVASIA